MSSFVRPELARALMRWRDTLIGLAIAALGLYWAFFTGGGLLHWIGYGLSVFGAVFAVSGIQRARFQMGDGGPGIVSVVEGRITYFGPLSGGVADLDALRELALDPTSQPPVWLLGQPGQPVLAIPLTAQGAEALFDAFAQLPGIQTEHMLRQMHGAAQHKVVIWRSASDGPATPRLH